MTDSFGTGGTGPLHQHHSAVDVDTAEDVIPPPPVTQPGRITGTTSRGDELEPTAQHELADHHDIDLPPRRRVDWPAIIASVVSGLGITLLLVTLGSSLGLEAASQQSNQDGDVITTSVGVWAIVAAVIGAFLGSFIGGRFARFLSRASAIYHGVASWGLTAVAVIALASLGVTGLLGSAMNAAANLADTPQAQSQVTGTQAGGAAANQPGDANTADQAADTSAKIGWAVTGGLLLTLLAACAGWFLGARWRLFGYEREGDFKLVR